MKVHSLRLLCTLLLITTTLTSVALPARYAREDPDDWPGVWYRIIFDENGDYVSGDGHGDGWHHYSATSGVYRMWFYNGPYDPERKGQLDYYIYTEPVDVNKHASAELTYSWSTPEWSALGLSHPPLPINVPYPQDEAKYIETEHLYTIPIGFFESIEPIAHEIIEAYNPEWVSIDITGNNILVFRGAFHDCIGDEPGGGDPGGGDPGGEEPGGDMGACCNRQTGACFISLESQCLPPYVWLGANTTCQACTTTPSTTSLDYGDAPDPSYPTRQSNDGARHIIVDGVYLGRSVDGETDGRPSSSATGDDTNGSDDEDGVTFASALWPSEIATVQVTASTFGYLNAWVDFDGDGDFDGTTEQIFADKLLSAGLNDLTFRVPAGAAIGDTYARFRFNTRGLLTFEGLADDGEVEDYKISISQYYAPQPGSGKGALTWSQPPEQLDPQTPYVFTAWNELSGMHLRQMLADDWQCSDNHPITGFHWWGSFEDWSQSLLPSQQPLAFHIGIWTDVPSQFPSTLTTFGHPGTLVWENYCTAWTWNVAGTASDPRGLRQDETCFQFTCLLSQDQWFHPMLDSQTASAVYWVSITAVYDTGAMTPQHAWGWTTRPNHFNSDAVQILNTSRPSTSGTSWPPNIGSQWEDGERVEYPRNVSWDLAFELLTNQGAGPGIIDGALAPVYQFWSDRLTTHFYTTSEEEKDWLIQKPLEWTYQGISFYAYPPDIQPAGAVPVYRFWSQGLARYLYTADENEKKDLIENESKTWTFEGIGWYAFN